MTFPLVEAITPGVTTGHADTDHEDIAKLVNNAVTTVAGTTYTLLASDFGRWVKTTSSSATSVTVPSGLFVGGATGCTPINFFQAGTGQLTLVAGSGMTLRTAGSLVARAQWSVLSLLVLSSSEGLVYGDSA